MREKGRKESKSAGQEVCASRPVFFFVLHDLFHETPHSGCCLILLLPAGMGVGAQGEPGIVVPRHGGHGFDVHAVLEGCGGEGVTEIMEADMLQSGVLQDLLM